MEDRKMEDQIRGKVRRWKMEDRKMEDQIWGEVRRWKMEDRKMGGLENGGPETHPAFTPARQAGTRFTDHLRVEG